MVFLAITTAGVRDAIALARISPFSIWCGADAISEAEYEALSGVDVSRFVYPLAGEDQETIEEALGTIAEHHPGQTVWVEHVVQPSQGSHLK